jgi:phage terminase Nu1 subunit (DNA packaging protein)
VKRIPDRVAKPELAEFVGLSVRRIEQLVAAKLLPQPEGGTLPFRASVRAILANKYAARTDEAGERSLTDQARKLRAEADLAEMEAKRQKGLLVNGPALKAALAQRDIAIKDRLLAVPMAGAHRAVEAAERLGVNGVAEVYEREIHAALSDLASATLVCGAERRG